MAKNRGSAVLRIHKLVKEDVDESSKRVKSEVANVLGEYEERKGRAETEVSKRRLFKVR